MNLDEVAKKLGYIDAEHLEINIYNYGEPLPQWWEVMKELVNKLPLNDVNKCCDICNSPLNKPPKYYDCNGCGEIAKSNDC
jgi:hypothetical protein